MKTKKTLDLIKKYGFLGFCLISVFMNALHYVKQNNFKTIGAPYQWNLQDQNGLSGSRDQSPAQRSAGADIITTASDPEESNSPSRPDRTQINGSEEFHTKDLQKTEFLLNINLAAEEELTQLPGIGPAKAASIIAYRNQYGDFTCIEELKEVRGIGEGIFEKVKDLITVE